MTRLRWITAPFFLLALATQAMPAEKSAEVLAKEVKEVEDRLKKDLAYLASDELEGRGPTTEGINKAADFIAAEFKKAGLKPAGVGGSYFQYFTIPGSRLTKPATLTLNGPKVNLELKAGTDFHPMGLSHSGAVRDAGLFFAGYGVVTEEIDEYKGHDVAGKVVVVLRDAPKFLGGNAKRKHAALVEKMTAAEKRDALAIIFVNDEDAAKDGDELLNFGFTAAARTTAKLPAFHLKRAVFDKLLAASGNPSLTEIEKAINGTKTPQSVALKASAATLEVQVKRDGIELKNVVGVLDGKGKLADETVVLGAHYDHLGYGGASSLAALKKMAIHNGADDNASGTTSVIELARRFGAHKDREGRRLVFMAFSGEEMGLLGSAHYCKAPIFSLENTAVMINLDMVGRMKKDPKNAEEKIQVHGTGTAKEFNTVIDKLNEKYKFKLQKQPGGMGPSDHASFYAKKVPVFFFFTGDHPDYHRPTDDWDKINYDAMRRVVDLVEELTDHFAKTPEKPAYIKVGGGTATGPRPQIRLGIKPAYADDGVGLLVEDVTEGFPAAKAGIKGGDRIIEMAGKKLKDIEAYMTVLAEQKKGETIDVKVLRKKEEVTVKVKLE